MLSTPPTTPWKGATSLLCGDGALLCGSGATEHTHLPRRIAWDGIEHTEHEFLTYDGRDYHDIWQQAAQAGATEHGFERWLSLIIPCVAAEGNSCYYCQEYDHFHIIRCRCSRSDDILNADVFYGCVDCNALRSK